MQKYISFVSGSPLQHTALLQAADSPQLLPPSEQLQLTLFQRTLRQPPSPRCLLLSPHQLPRRRWTWFLKGASRRSIWSGMARDQEVGRQRLDFTLAQAKRGNRRGLQEVKQLQNRGRSSMPENIRDLLAWPETVGKRHDWGSTTSRSQGDPQQLLADGAALVWRQCSHVHATDEKSRNPT